MDGAIKDEGNSDGNEQGYMNMIKPTCFLLLPRKVFPVVSGYSLKNYNLIGILSKKYRLTVGVISAWNLPEEEKQYYDSLGVRWFVHRIPGWKSLAHTAAGLFSVRPLQVSYYYDEALQKRVDEMAEKADILIAALIRTREYFRKWVGKKVLVFDMVDSIAMNYARSESTTKSLFWRNIYRIEGKRLAEFEKRWVRESSVTYLFNPGEREALDRYGKVICLPHGVSDSLFTYEKRDPAYAGAVVFMGKMDYQPNVDAVLWYLENVQAKIGEEIPFVIVGAYPTEEVKREAAKYPNVTVTGFVDDPYFYANSCMAMAAPMQSGGGIQNKVLEGMALGKVNLVSKLGAAALEGLDGDRKLILADRPEDYIRILLDMKKHTAGNGGAAAAGNAEEIIDALYDYAAIGKAAREYIRGHYTWQSYGEGYIAGIEDARGSFGYSQKAGPEKIRGKMRKQPPFREKT